MPESFLDLVSRGEISICEIGEMPHECRHQPFAQCSFVKPSGGSTISPYSTFGVMCTGTVIFVVNRGAESTL